MASLRSWLVGLAACHATPTTHQPTDPISLVEAKRVFSEAEAHCARDGGRLWQVPLCGPLLVVDPQTRAVVANRGLTTQLTARDGVFVGSLPPGLQIANTAITWGDIRWTEIMWPLPADRDGRAVLIMHELFHRVQPELGFTVTEAANVHLDEIDGRYYLQLELRALAAAVQASEPLARDRAVADALALRAARYERYPAAECEEDALERNEGLAEYTGVTLANSEPNRVAAIVRALAARTDDPSLVRSFAYATGPAYGLLMDRYVPGWQRGVARAPTTWHGLRERLTTTATADAAAERHGGQALRASELARAERRAAERARYQALLVDGPLLVLPFSHMKIEFDPRAVVPLGDHGSVYPKLRVIDDWGVLDASDGALVRADWSAVVVTAPPSIGWRLTLARGWKITAGARAGSFTIARGN